MAVTEPVPYAIAPVVGVYSRDPAEGVYLRQVKRGNVVFGGLNWGVGTMGLPGKQVELGLKTEDLFDQKLTGSVAVFRIQRLNTLISVAPADQVAYFGRACSGVPDGENCYFQGTREESKGAELELNVHPLENWQTTFGYSYIDATVSKAPIAAQQGSRLLNTARNSGNYGIGDRRQIARQCNRVHTGTGNIKIDRIGPNVRVCTQDCLAERARS